MMTILAALSKGEPMVYILAIICAIIMMSISIRRRLRDKSGGPQYTASERLNDVTMQRGLRSDMEKLLVELQELSRKINAQIDTKFAKLESSIQDADRRIAELQRLLGADSPQKNGGATSPSQLDITVGDDADASPSPRLHLHPGSTSSSLDDRKARIYQLADAGKSSIEIAQIVGQTPGEIELILSLRPR